MTSSSIGMKTAGVVAKRLDPGKYLVVVTAKSKTDDFDFAGPGVNKRTAVGGTGTVRWNVTLAPGTYRFSSDKNAKLHGSFEVS